MKVLKVNDMLKHDSTVLYNQDYYEEKKEGEEKKEIAGLSVPSAIDISKFMKTDDDKIIKSITPLAMYNYKVSYHDYTQLSFLAKNATGKIFIINCIFDTIFEGDDTIVEFAKEHISFFEDKNYLDNRSRELVNKMLIQSLPNYYTNLDIMFKDDKFSMEVIVGDGVYENKEELVFDAPIMNTIKFTVAYITDCVLNNHDIVLSNYYGFIDIETSLYKIKNVVDIVNLAPLNEEKTAIAIMLKITDENDKESFLLFVANYINDKIKSKLNSTMEDITSMFRNNSDYWLADFFYSTKLNDDDYIVYSAKNNEGKHTTYLFNKECIDKIETLLNK